MWPLLYDHWTEDLSQTPAEVRQCLADHVRPKRTFRELLAEIVRIDPHEKPFEGVVSESEFKICRVIHYRNSYLPHISGELHPISEGIRVTITMRLDRLVLGFLVFWAGCVACSGIIILCAVPNRMALLIPVVMFLFMAALSIGGFEVERRKARQLLDPILHLP
jgi:hypothetical protein